jgi:hypothetical protein
MAKASKLGGEKFSVDTFTEATVRAELIALAHGCCLAHGAKVVDKILEEYTVAPRRSGVARHIPL